MARQQMDFQLIKHDIILVEGAHTVTSSGALSRPHSSIEYQSLARPLPPWDLPGAVLDELANDLEEEHIKQIRHTCALEAVMVKVYRRITLGVIVVALAGLAFWWLSPTPTTSVRFDRQADFCDKTLASPYLDVHSEFLTDPSHRQRVVKASFAGPDYHLVITASDGTGPIWYQESMRVDGKYYTRKSETLGEGKWEIERHWRGARAFLANLIGIPELSAASVRCPELKNMVKIGQETIDGATMTRYQRTFSYDFAKDFAEEVRPQGDHVVFYTLDYWADSEGQLTRVKATQSYPPQEPGGQRYLQEQVTKISGIGEPNVITAPVVP